MALAIGFFALRAFTDTAEQTVVSVVESASRALQPRVERSLATSLASIGGAGQAFLVAYTARAVKEATASDTLRTVFGIPLGTPRVHATWEFTVDLGIDLVGAPEDAFAVSCEDSLYRCTWSVPDPSSRAVAVDTATLKVEQDGALLVFSAVERDQRQRLVEGLTELSEAMIATPGFWETHREAVRANLREFAEDAFGYSAEPGEPRISFDVTFASERDVARSELD